MTQNYQLLQFITVAMMWRRIYSSSESSTKYIKFTWRRGIGHMCATGKCQRTLRAAGRKACFSLTCTAVFVILFWCPGSFNLFIMDWKHIRIAAFVFPVGNGQQLLINVRGLLFSSLFCCPEMVLKRAVKLFSSIFFPSVNHFVITFVTLCNKTAQKESESWLCRQIPPPPVVGKRGLPLVTGSVGWQWGAAFQFWGCRELFNMHVLINYSPAALMMWPWVWHTEERKYACIHTS